MDLEQCRQAATDEEDLRLLPIFYWVSGAMTAFFSLYFLFYVAFGLFFALMPASAWQSSPPPPFLGWFFVAIGFGGVLFIGGLSALKVLTGFWIKKRKRRVLCLVVAGLSCAEVPYGTLGGILTFTTLMRPSVVALFNGLPPGNPDVSEESDSGGR